jgi:hypothetical protein
MNSSSTGPLAGDSSGREDASLDGPGTRCTSKQQQDPKALMSSSNDPRVETGDPRRAAMRTAWLGITHALLVLISYVLLAAAPGADASDEAFSDFYSSSSGSWKMIVAGLYLMPFAAIAFMWFIIALRMWIRRSSPALRDELYATGQLVSGIIFLALFFTGAAAISVLAVSTEIADVTVDPDVARQFTELGWALIVVFSMRMGAVFIITTSVLGRRHEFLPTWFIGAGYLVGIVLLLSANVSSLLVLVMPLWLLVLGGILMVRSSSLGPALSGQDGGSTVTES